MDKTKKWYQSSTIRNAIISAVAGALTLTATVTGIDFNVNAITQSIDSILASVGAIIVMAASIKAALGRKKADTKIE